MAILVPLAGACQPKPAVKQEPAAPQKTAEKPKPDKPLLPPPRPEQALPEQNQFYRKSGSGFLTLQKANEAMAGFPVDRVGGINWVKALRQGIINPRADLKGETEKQVLDMDIVMTETREMPHVRFPHLAHTEWLDCVNCHDAIFKPQTGANDITMNEIFKGRYCGVCHGKVAFSSWVCERCHSVTHKESPEVWW